MLTREQVETFLVEKLGLPDWEARFSESKEVFIQDLILAFGLNIYFQNVTYGSLPLSERKLPSPEESIETVTKNAGGCCIQNNYVFACILKVLGLNAYLVGVDMDVWKPLIHPHVLVILKMTDTEIYAIDVGFSRPILQLTPLHDLPCRGKAGGFEYEVRFNAETGFYERVLFEGDAGDGVLKESKGGQNLDYYFDLTPRPFEHFDTVMKQLFVDADAKFMKVQYMYRLTRATSVNDFDYVSVSRKRVAEGSADELKITHYNTYQEMQPVLEKLFPNLNKKALREALVKYDAYVAEKDNPQSSDDEST